MQSGGRKQKSMMLGIIQKQKRGEVRGEGLEHDHPESQSMTP